MSSIGSSLKKINVLFLCACFFIGPKLAFAGTIEINPLSWIPYSIFPLPSAPGLSLWDYYSLNPNNPAQVYAYISDAGAGAPTFSSSGITLKTPIFKSTGGFANLQIYDPLQIANSYLIVEFTASTTDGLQCSAQTKTTNLESFTPTPGLNTLNLPGMTTGLVLRSVETLG